MDEGEEEIEVKPPIDKIADEYFKKDNDAKIDVHLFSTKNEEARCKVKLLKEKLPEEDYEFFYHCLETDNCKDVLNNIISSSKNARGLILFFCGKSNSEGELRMFDGETDYYYVLHDIWTMFYTEKCPHLKNKPKIFIFEVKVVQLVDTDGFKKVPIELAYDTPNEADIFVLYHKCREDGVDDYVENFCKNITLYGKSEDITTLATCVARPLHVPILISTFTKKFYFLPSKYRGHNYNITEKHKDISSELEIIKEMMRDVTSKKSEKSTRKPSFIRRIFGNNSSNESDKSKEKLEKEKGKKSEKEKNQKENEKIPKEKAERSKEKGKRVKNKIEEENVNKNATITKTESVQGLSSTESIVAAATVNAFPPPRASVSSITEAKGVKSRTKPTKKQMEIRKSRTVSTASDDSKKTPWKY